MDVHLLSVGRKASQVVCKDWMFEKTKKRPKALFFTALTDLR
jgi:hypothetical protein